jgi:polar amino acid transport system substrate-binding protein
MDRTRRLLAGVSLALPLWLAGCASAPAVDAAAKAALVPTGTLRVAVYQGSPTSMVRKPSGETAGVAYDLGQALARELGVPVSIVEFPRVQLVIDALKAGQADMTFTNATEARARDVDFTEPLVRLELGFLVPGDSPLRSVADIDRPGLKVGVSQGSSSQQSLPRLYKAMALVPATSLEAAQQQLRSKAIDAFATNKGVLYEMGDQLPGSRVLDGRWGVEHLAIAVPKGREAGAPFLKRFAQSQRDSGQLQKIVERAGVRGAARD